MDLNLDIYKAEHYSNKSQIARIITEDWTGKNCYCPNCGNSTLSKFDNNSPVADFSCATCSEEFELKSKGSIKVGNRIVDGAYNSMISRINSDNNPNFFFLNYNRANWTINNFLLIPKHFFVTDIIEKRKPLAAHARRAGWTGCNINLSQIPATGRIFLIKDSIVIPKDAVLKQWKNTCFLKEKKQETRAWIIDVMKCLDQIHKNEFSLDEVYAFDSELKIKHPNNNHIKDKIRQQLQVIRDKGLIEFIGKGKYRKVNYETI